MFADEGVQTHLAHFLILQMYLADLLLLHFWDIGGATIMLVNTSCEVF